MESDEFLELVRKRRSARSFKPDPVPDEYIDKILEAGRWAMSGGNGQPWEFIVIKDRQIREGVMEIYQEVAWHAYNLETTRRPELAHSARAAPPSKLCHFKDAPVILAVCGDMRTMLASVVAASLYPDAHVFQMNLGNSMQIIHLAAASLGLGSAWISIPTVVEEKLRSLLGVPAVFRIYAIIPVGYPDAKPAPPYRRELSEIVHLDHYDMSKYRSEDEVIAFIAQLRKKSRAAYRSFVESDN